MIFFALLVCAQKSAPPAPAERITKAFAKALQGEDYAWFERHLAPDFVYRGLDGDEEDRAATLGHIRRWFHPLVYTVSASIAPISARKAKPGWILVSDLKVRSQPIRPWRTPMTETTVRVESRWLPKGDDWTVQRIAEKSRRKTVDGKAVEEKGKE